MRPLRDTIPLDDARRLIDAALHPIARDERIPVEQANGRVLVHDIVADRDVPPFSRAAMDGYAVRAQDTFGASRSEPRSLRLVDTVHTGQVGQREVRSGTCVQIATGAPVPAGADAVVMVEETEPGPAGEVRVLTPVYPRQNIGRQGADIASGQTVLAAGTLLNPSRIGALAALGQVDVAVFARPTVALLSTGDEIVDPGQPLLPGQIYDINRFTLAAVVAEHGGIAVPHRTAADTLDDLECAIDACLPAEAIAFSGGSSVGDRDLILDAIKRRGEIVFHGIAVKPGKPMAFGLIDGTPVFGLPGYPTSCLSNAYILLAPALRRIARLPPHRPQTVTLPLAQRIVSTAGRHQFYTVRIDGNEAVPAFKASGDITSMSRADGYIEIPLHVDIVEKGEPVAVTLF